MDRLVRQWPLAVSMLGHLSILIWLAGAKPAPTPAVILPEIVLLPANPGAAAGGGVSAGWLRTAQTPITSAPLPEASRPMPRSAAETKVVSTSGKGAEAAPSKPPIHKLIRWHHAAPRPSKSEATPRGSSVAATIEAGGNKAERRTGVRKGGLGGGSGSGAGRRSGPGATAGSGFGPGGPPPTYLGVILARLEKVKEYPAEARTGHKEGTVLLRFIIGRSGRLLSWRIERQSGVQSLDNEAGTMVRKASPFPPFPGSLDRERMELVVPVKFSLQ